MTVANGRRQGNLESSKELTSILAYVTEDRQRKAFFRDHPQLRAPSTIETLSGEAVRLLRVDLRQAEQLASTAMWLADELDDDYCRGRSQRAAANVSHFKGNHGPAASLYEAAIGCFQRAGNAEEAAITRSSALRNLVFLGEYQQAFEWASAAREVFKKSGDRLRLARLELNLASIFFRQDRWEEAAERYEIAYEEFRSVGKPQDVAISLRNMAVCHVSLNNFRQALKYYEQAREYCLAEELPLLVGEIDYNIAYLYFLRGEYTRAIEIYQETRKRCEEIGERYHMALCDLDQAEIFLELNLVEESVDLAQRAFASFDELGMPYETAKSLVNLAIAVNRQGKAFLTLELLGKAREIFVDEENQVWPALIDLYEALVMYRAGRPLEAARLASSARDGFLLASLPTKIAMCEVLLARLYLQNSDFEKARELSAAALERLRALDVPGLSCQVYFVLGQIEEELGDRDAALEAYRSSQDDLEQLRSHLQTEELKIDFLEDKLSVYEYFVSLVLRGGATGGENRAVFSCIEKAKARSLADLMAVRAHSLPPTSAARSDQAELVRKLREELNWYYRQIDLQEMRGSERSREEVFQLREVSRRQENHLVRTLRELQASDQEFSSLQEAATVDIERIRAVMPGNTLLVEYYIACGIIYACVMGRDQLDIVPVTVVSRARELHRLMRFQFSKFELGSEYVEEFSEVINDATGACLRDLYSELVAPIRGLLSKKRLVVIPHSFLHYLPFQALLDGNCYLVDQYHISYAPSAGVYYLCCKKSGSSSEGSLVLSTSCSADSGTLSEAESVAAMLPGSRLVVGREADLGSIRTYGSSCRYIFIGSRATFRADNPMFSSIRLGSSSLNLFDLYNLKLQADIVLLSGCGVDPAAGGEGDEFVGMTRGFLYAGAQAVVAALWDVNDECRSLLVNSFFRILGVKSDRAAALRKAMLEVRRDYPHPYYWAQFVLVGRSA